MDNSWSFVFINFHQLIFTITKRLLCIVSKKTFKSCGPLLINNRLFGLRQKFPKCNIYLFIC